MPAVEDVKEDPHARLKSLLQDRKSASPKGRASRRLAVCLSSELSMDFEDAEESLAAVRKAVAEATDGADKRAGGKVAIDPELTKRLKAAEKAAEEAEAAVDAGSVVITFTALKADEFDVVLKEHPPREGDKTDEMYDYNRDTFPDALMLKTASSRVEDPDGNLVDMDINDLIDTMSNGERTLACQVALDVNLRQSSFSEAKSLNRQRSGNSSKRR